MRFETVKDGYADLKILYLLHLIKTIDMKNTQEFINKIKK